MASSYSSLSCLGSIWVPPDPGVVKVKVNGAFSADLNGAGIGVGFRNSEGQVIEGYCGRIAIASSFMAEAMVIRTTFEIAVALGLDNLMWNLTV